jgi:murein L,D-transpeptidase YafK
VIAIMVGWHRLILISGVCLTLAACNDTLSSVSNKVEHPLPTKVVNRMKAYDMSVNSPIMMRVFKEESVLEVWKQQRGSGRFEKIAEYEICKWSGELGPKRVEGDRQAPEGFYHVAAHQMNPNSSYYLSFNLGYPNKFDRSHGRTGSNLMVHGACSSAGCYSMSDENVLEIYAFAREAFRGGQQSFQVQAFPFRMTAENMARHRGNENYEFWKMLKVGYDHFELTKRPPKVDVCEQRYVFNQVTQDEGAVFNATAACPTMTTPDSLQVAYQSYVQSYEKAYDEALRKQDKAGVRSSRLNSFLPLSSASGASPDASTQTMSMPAASALVPAISSEQAPAAEAVVPLPAAATPASAPAAAAVPVPASPPESAASVPVGQAMPVETAAVATAPVPSAAEAVPSNKPFWNLWSRN